MYLVTYQLMAEEVYVQSLNYAYVLCIRSKVYFTSFCHKGFTYSGKTITDEANKSLYIWYTYLALFEYKVSSECYEYFFRHITKRFCICFIKCEYHFQRYLSTTMAPITFCCPAFSMEDILTLLLVDIQRLMLH
jgi:hypothetical protein